MLYIKLAGRQWYEHWENCKKRRLGAFLRLQLSLIFLAQMGGQQAFPPFALFWSNWAKWQLRITSFYNLTQTHAGRVAMPYLT